MPTKNGRYVTWMLGKTRILGIRCEIEYFCDNRNIIWSVCRAEGCDMRGK